MTLIFKILANFLSTKKIRAYNKKNTPQIILICLFVNNPDKVFPKIIATKTNARFINYSAVTSGIKEIKEVISNNKKLEVEENKMSKSEKLELMACIENEMHEAARNLDFERATELRDALFELKANI